MTRLKFIILFFLFKVTTCMALVPLESLVLGDFSGDYQDSLDPLNYIFSIGVAGSDVDKSGLRKQISLYRGIYQEGQNLEKFCSKAAPLKYESYWDQKENLRSLVATLQYMGIDITTRAIPQYAKELGYSASQYELLVNNLISNNCSQNISIISLKQLHKLLLTKFNSSNDYKLPSVGGNDLFPESTDNIATKEQILKNEFALTLLNFRAFCSWGGDIDDLRLLVPFVKNPTVMALINRQFSGLDLAWNEIKKEISMQDSQNTIRVLCDNMVCRKTQSDTFERLIKLSIGSHGIFDDANRMYCQDLFYRDYNYKLQSKKIKKWMDDITPEQEKLVISQFMALITGIPDFSNRIDRLSTLEEISRYSVDRAWNDWAKDNLKTSQKELLFEEPMVLEKVDNKLYYNRFRPEFKVVFDVNQGEFDRINQVHGKITLQFDLKIAKSFLGWARREWLTLEPKKVKQKDRVLISFNKQVEQFVYIAKEKMIIAPWTTGLEKLIVSELLDQLSEYRGDFFTNPSDHSIVTIPIQINYAPYALKYISYKRMLQKQIKNEN